jgi:hypothetical protein
MYRGDEILSPLVREISWTKNLVILERCKDALERELGWSKNVLIHQVENQTYQKPSATKQSSKWPYPKGFAHKRASR